MNKDNAPENINRTLAHLPLFQSLTPEQRSAIAASAQDIHLVKGQLLFHAGETPGGFFIVAFGQMKLFMTSPGGDEKVVEIIAARQSFGEAVMFLQRPYPVSAVALTDAWLFKIPQHTVDQLLSTDPSFARRMLAGLSVRLHSLIQDVESYSMHSSTQRVIGYLLQQCPEDSTENQEITLPTSKLVIASRLNLTPETLSRSFQELGRLSLIAVDGRSIHIPSVKRLREFMG